MSMAVDTIARAMAASAMSGGGGGGDTGLPVYEILDISDQTELYSLATSLKNASPVILQYSDKYYFPIGVPDPDTGAATWASIIDYDGNYTFFELIYDPDPDEYTLIGTDMQATVQPVE